MNTIIEQRKQNWIDFSDLKSPVSRILMAYCDEISLPDIQSPIDIASMFSFETEKEAAAFADQYNEETARIKEYMQL